MKKTFQVLGYTAYNATLFALAWLACDVEIAGAQYLIAFASLFGWVTFLAAFSNQICREIRAKKPAVPLRVDHVVTMGLVAFLIWNGFFLTAAGFFIGSLGSEALRTRTLPS